MKNIVRKLRDIVVLEGEEVNTKLWQGSSNPPTMIEVLHVSEKIQMEDDISKLSDMLNAKQPWADIHFKERVQGFPTNPDPSYKMWSREAGNYKTDDKIFSHTYTERLWSKDLHTGIRFDIADLNTLVKLLKDIPDTRQAYLPMFFPEDLTAAVQKERAPCTLGWQFIIRNNRLDIFYPMRSCDVMRHLHNDLYFANRLGLWVIDKAKLKVDIGVLHFVATSLHCFSNDKILYERGFIK